MTEYTSIKADILKKLQENLPEIRERFEIETIGIFGSIAREEDTPDSDVDILYVFRNGSLPLRDFFAFKTYLEDLFCREVDLVSVKWMAPAIRPYVEQDMILFSSEVAAV